MTNSRSIPLAALTCVLATYLVAFALLGSPQDKPPSVFQLPELLEQYAKLQAMIQECFVQGLYEEAERRALEAVQLWPHIPDGHYNLACAQARQGKTDLAIQNLAAAIAAGYRQDDWLQKDPDLESLHKDPRWAELIAKAAQGAAPPSKPLQYKIRPLLVGDGQAWVREENTAWDAARGVFFSFFAFPKREELPKPNGSNPTEPTPADSPEKPAPPSPRPIILGHGDVGDLLRQWFQEGTAAGNCGDLYHNHDGDHSNLAYDQFPQCTRLEFDDVVKQRNLHLGLQCRFLYNCVTFGNSSMADVSGPFWRSLPRMAYTDPRRLEVLLLHYVSNHIYVYPEHRDHDPGHNGREGYGDLYCANTPYLIISQGSSGSDQPFLDALACTLAAFRPEVKARLTERRVIAPTLQMILRACGRQLESPEDYLTGKAHPSVFQADQLDVLKMVRFAHDMREDELPPLIQLRVVEEDKPVLGRDYFEIGPRERLFDSPSAIARVGRSTQYKRRMVISAEASLDLQGRPLKWHWAVLRGNRDLIEIHFQNATGSVAELIIPYHSRQLVQPGSNIESNRVDIGVFVHNGKYFSAPGFVTWYFLDNEVRIYNERQQIRLMLYTDPVSGGNYADPAIQVPKSWRDEYYYDRQDRPSGWTRFGSTENVDFTADGARILTRDAQGRAVEAQTVVYVAKRRENQPPVLDQQPGDEILHYEYASEADRVGRVIKRTKVEKKQ